MFLKTLLPERPMEDSTAAFLTGFWVLAGPGLPPSLDVKEVPRAQKIALTPTHYGPSSHSAVVSGSWD